MLPAVRDDAVDIWEVDGEVVEEDGAVESEEAAEDAAEKGRRAGM